jgi:hypothetical protein
VISDEHCDLVRQQAAGPRSVRFSTYLWESETCALFTRGSKIASRTKETLTQQLLDGDLRSFLLEKQHWNSQHFESIDWKKYSTAYKRLSKGRKTAVAQATHNLWHTGTRHQQYYGGSKLCCMCNCEIEDWRHIITCGSLDSSLHRASSWEKLRKSMERWHLLPDFWTTIEKDTSHYKEHPHKRTANSTNNESQKPFGVTFTASRNLLQQAFRTQSHIGWDNFLKGRISRDWLTYVHYNEEDSNGDGKSKDWSAKFIGGLWDHLKCMWQFRNDIYHQDNQGNIVQYKLEALDRDMEKIWARHTELLPKLHDFQKQHFDRRQRIVDLRYENKKYWETLATLYLHDTETNISGFSSDIERIIGWRT